MNESSHYIIVAVPCNGKQPTHHELAELVNFQITQGYEPLGAPFFGEEMMYQAMVRFQRK